MLHIVCVNKGNYLGRGVEYVNILYDQVRRNLEAGTKGEFVVFTDREEKGYHPDIVQRLLPDTVSGWWAKIFLFKDGLFPYGDRILFFDLDTLVVGTLDDVVQYQGDFAMLRDFYRPQHMQSSVMAWRSGFGTHIWDEYLNAGMPTHDPLGDQNWIEGLTEPDVLQDLFPGAFVSYKVHCKPYPPRGARIIVFHGKPRPHEVEGWVADTWKIGGLGALEISVKCNTELGHIERNVRHALTLGLPEVVQQDPHDGDVCIVGGAPSLKKYLPELMARAQNGAKIWALNNTAQYLADNGVRVDGQWIVDARPHNARFVTPHGIKYLASQCDQSVFLAAMKPIPFTDWDNGIVLYHEAECDQFIPQTRAVTLIGGGTTVGMKAIAGAYALGYRRIYVFGMDSSVDGDEHHVYAQPENDQDFRLNVHVEDETFISVPWMVRQAEDFQGLASELVNAGCEIAVRCDGLLGAIGRKWAAQCVEPTETDGDVVLYHGWWRPVSDRVSVQAVEGEAWKLDKVVDALQPIRRRIAIQAGGHVGIFPMKLADMFETVHTFEPDDVNFKCLMRNVTKQNIMLHHAALGRERGVIALTEREGNNCGSIGVDTSKVGNIPVRRIDDMNLSGVDLIYLDIEGMEGLALWGALETVLRDRPLIVCENKGLDEVSGAEGALQSFMTRAGYKCVSRLMRDDVFAPLERADLIAERLAA